jgi:3-deoxy-7-phosphoheptulonate synthase
MIIIMKSTATEAEIKTVSDRIAKLGFTPHVINGEKQTVVGAIGDADKQPVQAMVSLPGVSSVQSISKPYKLAARSSKEEDTVVKVGNVEFGPDTFVVVAGPCSVESEEQLTSTAKSIKKAGASLLRGGAYKPRSSPYAFQGLEEEGLKLLKKAKDETGLGIVTELLSVAHVDLVAEYTDVIQIGARNMQNFSLLKELGSVKKPVLLKRGLTATIEELLMSAEYIMSEGNYDVILCERGIRTYEKEYRNVLDLNSVPALKLKTHLPIVVDPSHGTGRVDLIPAMSKAAIAAGADGILIEVHPNPAEALSDGPQSLTFAQFDDLMKEIKPFVEAAGKKLVIL